MRTRFTLYRRSGVFYCQDTETGKQQSLRTREKAEAQTLLHAKNEALRQPTINRQIARAYLTACDGQVPHGKPTGEAASNTQTYMTTDAIRLVRRRKRRQQRPRTRIAK